MMFKPVLFVLSTIGVVLVGGPRVADAEKQAPAVRGKPAKVPTVIVAPGEKADVAAVSQASKIWIGIRCTPVPEALAAHIGRGGLMIANVIEGSPADRAGVERYDVLESVNGVKIESMDQLVDQIVGNGTSKPAAIALIRSGAARTLEVTPVERPTDTDLRYKYEEPRGPEVDEDVQYFGHQFRRDPGGSWMLQPLGRIGNLPDDVKDSLKDLGNPAWQDLLKAIPDNPFRFRIQTDPTDPQGNMFFFPDDADDANAKVEISISVNENGQQMRIRRSAEGGISVSRTSPNGDVSEKTFDTIDAMRENDPEAYAAYRRFSGYRSRSTIVFPPEWKDLDRLQRDYQEKIESALERARERSSDALNNTRSHRDAGASKAPPGGADSTTSRHSTESIELNTDDSGHIRLNVSKNGESRSYEFKNREEFKRSEPALYERFKHMLDSARRTQRPAALALAIS